MGSIQNLVRWVRDRTSKKKKGITTKENKNADDRPERDGLPSSNRSSLYGFHRPDAKDRIAKEQICENTLYPKSSAGMRGEVRRNSPFRLYNESPAHVYEEIPGALVVADLKNENEARTTTKRMNLKNFDFNEAKEVGAYLVVPIRKQLVGTNSEQSNSKVGLIRAKDLVIVQSTAENLTDPQTALSGNDTTTATTTQLCSNKTNRLHKPGSHHIHAGHGLPEGAVVSNRTMVPNSQNNNGNISSRQVVAEIHHSIEDSTFDQTSFPPPPQEEYIHCKKCKRPHGIYKDDFMEHYESDDNVFDEPDLIKDSQVKDYNEVKIQGQGQGQDQGHEDMEGVLDSDESVYGIREQIYSTTEELRNNETYLCTRCMTEEYQQTKCNFCDKGDKYSSKEELSKSKGKTPYWKKYITIGRKPPSQPMDIPGGISYTTVSTRLSPNTQLLLDGRHYKTLPIDLVTPVKPSGQKKPFGYDKLELSKGKVDSKAQYNITTETPSNHPNQSQSVLQNEDPDSSEASVPKWLSSSVTRGPHNIKPRSVSCSDIIDDDSDSRFIKDPKTRNASVSEECEYMAMAFGTSPRDKNSSFGVTATPEHSPTGLAMEKKKAKILKSISKNKSKENNIVTLNQGGAGGSQKQRSISMTDNDIYNCDAETKRKIHILTRNKLSSTWNGPRPPPKGIQPILSRHSTLPHSFSPNLRTRGVTPFNGPSSPLQKTPFTRSSDSLLLPKQLSSKDFHTLSKNSGFPGSLYLRQGGLQGKLKEQMLRKRRFASSSDCLLSSTIAEEAPSSAHGSKEKLSCRATHVPRGRSLSYDANAQTYTNAAAIAQNQACAYQRRHNPILSDLMRVNNDRQTLMLV